ncbi:hypothetical protein [Candidatus Thioglobus sp.]|uniref:hypothetical protein n=1 Tax=Candidatus Thioglobus sp. TaxID=2026721 RepID=UPI003D0D6AF9
MNKQKYFMAVPNEIMSTKHPLHYELLNFDTNIELKVFITVLATATMIFKANKNKGIQTFSTVGFLGDNSFLPKSINLKKLTSIIQNMETPFFDTLTINHKTVSFKISDTYKKSVTKKGFSQVNLMALKSHKDLKTTKLAILTKINPKGYLSLNYLLKVLNVNQKLSRTGRIREIKQAFKNLEKLGLLNWEYKYPVNKNVEVLPEHYKFHYETINNETAKTEETVRDDEPELKQNIDEVFNTEDLDKLLEELKERPCKPDCVKSSSKIRHNPLIYPHVGL